MNYAGSRVKREIAVPCANHEGIWAPHILHLNTRRVNNDIHVPVAIYPGKELPIHIKQEAGSERFREDINVSLPAQPLA